MENDFTKIEDAFKKAPAEIKGALLSPELENTLWEIMERSTISPENKERVTDEVGSILLGISSRESLENSIKKNTGITSEVAITISKEIEEKIIKPLERFIKHNDTEKKLLSPSILPTTASHFEPMTQEENSPGAIVLENQNPFLPMLNKTADDRQKTLDNRQPDAKEGQKIPGVTSALAAEIGNLLNRETQNTESQNAKRVTYNAGGEGMQLERQNVKHTTLEENIKSIPQVPNKPEDKLVVVTQIPKVEVDMVKREISKENQIDPYREAI